MAGTQACKDEIPGDRAAWKLKFLLGGLSGVFVGCGLANSWKSCCPSLGVRVQFIGIGNTSQDEAIGVNRGTVVEGAKPGVANVGNPFTIGKSAEKPASCADYFNTRPGTEFHVRNGPQTRFVLFAMPGSGTHFLVSLLGQHPELLANYEAFNPAGVFAEGWNYTRTGQRNKDRNKFLNQLFDPANPKYEWRKRKSKKKSVVALGVDILPHHLSLEEFRSLAKTSSIKKIVLRRRHALRQFVSELKALQTHKLAKLNTSGVKVHVDVDKFQNFAKYHRRYYDVCIHHHFEKRSPTERANWFFLDYESLTRHPVRSINKIFKFLGVNESGQDVRERTIKEDASPLSESISNVDEVRLALGNTSELGL